VADVSQQVAVLHRFILELAENRRNRQKGVGPKNVKAGRKSQMPESKEAQLTKTWLKETKAEASERLFSLEMSSSVLEVRIWFKLVFALLKSSDLFDSDVVAWPGTYFLSRGGASCPACSSRP
jgi:hypothetical protein